MPEYGDRTRWEHKHMQGINANSIDRIGEHLPMARRLRPEWDVQELQKLGAKEVCSNVTNEKILEDGPSPDPEFPGKCGESAGITICWFSK